MYGVNTSRMNQRLCALALLTLMSASACGGESPSPSAPSPPPAAAVNIAGQWRGIASDSSGPGSITIQLTQSSTNLSGTVTMAVTGTSITGRGTLTGTLTGSTLRFTITIPAGGFDAPYASCNVSVSGDGRATATSITASYSGTNSCSGAVTGGDMNLSKL
jgi:hypothetical protein